MARHRYSAGRRDDREDNASFDTTETRLDGELLPVIGALRAVEHDLRREHIDRAWVDLDIAAQRLARHGSQPGAASPALDRAVSAVERARDLLGRAQIGQASAAIAGAVVTLLA